MVTYEQFLRLMLSLPPRGGLVGIEQERALLCQETLRPVAASPAVLSLLDPTYHTPEPSAVQVETKTLPVYTGSALYQELDTRLRESKLAAEHLGLRLEALPVLPEDMPQDIFPSDKYRAVARMLSGRGSLLAALRVVATQVNLGCSSWSELLERYHRLVGALPQLLALGDRSQGERRRLYHQAVPDTTPPTFESPEAVWQAACEAENGNPAKLHKDIVVKPGLIIEVRCLDAVADIREIEWLADEVMHLAGCH